MQLFVPYMTERWIRRWSAERLLDPLMRQLSQVDSWLSLLAETPVCIVAPYTLLHHRITVNNIAWIRSSVSPNTHTPSFACPHVHLFCFPSSASLCFFFSFSLSLSGQSVKWCLNVSITQLTSIPNRNTPGWPIQKDCRHITMSAWMGH